MSVSTIMSRSILYYSIFIVAMYQFLSHMSTQQAKTALLHLFKWPAWSLQLQVRLLEILPWHGREEDAIWCNGFRILNHVFHGHCLLGIYYNLLPKSSGMTSKTIKTQGRFTSSGSSRPLQALEVQAQFDRIFVIVMVCHGVLPFFQFFPSQKAATRQSSPPQLISLYTPHLDHKSSPFGTCTRLAN